MKIDLLKSILKKDSLGCYNDALHSLYNNPFGDEIGAVKKDVILSKVNQNLRFCCRK